MAITDDQAKTVKAIEQSRDNLHSQTLDALTRIERSRKELWNLITANQEMYDEVYGSSDMDEQSADATVDKQIAVVDAIMDVACESDLIPETLEQIRTRIGSPIFP